MRSNCCFAAATAVVTCVASAASADLVVTHATVTHGFTPQVFNTPETTTETLNANFPGGSFTTYDGDSGFTADLTATGGSVRMDTRGVSLYPMPGYKFYTVDAVINFTIDAPFSIAPVAGSGGWTGGGFAFKNDATGDAGQATVSPSGNAFYSGDLDHLKLPAGQYTLTTGADPIYSVGMSGPGFVAMSIAVVPEPVSIATASAGALMVLRRRRA